MVFQRVSGFQTLVTKNLRERRFRGRQSNTTPAQASRQPPINEAHSEKLVRLLEWDDLRKSPTRIASDDKALLTDLHSSLEAVSSNMHRKDKNRWAHTCRELDMGATICGLGTEQNALRCDPVCEAGRIFIMNQVRWMTR